MKKLVVALSIVWAGLLLAWCWGSKEEVIPEETFDNPIVTDKDQALFDTIMDKLWISEGEDNESNFIFNSNNTFVVTLGEKTSTWPWIISEGKILLGTEQELPVEVTEEGKLVIKGITYAAAK